MSSKISRRTVLLRGLQIPVGGVLLSSLSACGGGASGSGTAARSAGAVCADPHAMTDAEQRTRASINYTEASQNPQETCAGCAFFHPAASGDCGTCDMFSGGVVNGGGRCDSWSAKG